MGEKLELTCPKCLKENSTNVRTELHCKYCQEELTDSTYIKKPIIHIQSRYSIIFGIILGSIGSIYIYIKLEPNRYSTAEEYLVIRECILLQKQPWSSYAISRKEEICIDALTATLEDVKDYDEDVYQQNSPMFMKLIKQNAIDQK